VHHVVDGHQVGPDEAADAGVRGRLQAVRRDLAVGIGIEPGEAREQVGVGREEAGVRVEVAATWSIAATKSAMTRRPASLSPRPWS